MSEVCRGLPVAADVERLCKRWPAPAKGEIITYGELAEVVGFGPQTARFRTIVRAWRKRMLAERLLVIVGVRGIGLRILEDGGTTGTTAHAYSHFARASKEVKRGSVELETVNPLALDPAERARYDHTRQVLNKARQHFEEEARELEAIREMRRAL